MLVTTPNPNILQHFSKCPLCEAEYNGARVSVIEQRGDQTVFHVTCPSCETRMLMMMTQGQQGVMCVGSVTDIAVHELGRLAQSKIQPNAVLDLYVDLQQYKGSLETLMHAQPTQKAASFVNER